MAKIQEQSIKIKVSKLVKDTDPDANDLLDTGDIENLEAVIRELTEQSVLIEIEKNSE